MENFEELASRLFGSTCWPPGTIGINRMGHTAKFKPNLKYLPFSFRRIADATATAFQNIATLACSVAVFLLYLSAFASGYSDSPGLRGQAPPWRSGQISARELGRAGVWGLLVFVVAEFLVFIVMTDLRKRGEREQSSLWAAGCRNLNLSRGRRTTPINIVPRQPLHIMYMYSRRPV